jgi:ABC-2 type transport system permease protein
LEDLRTVPLTPQAILWAMGLAAVVRGLIVGAVTFFVGFAFYYFKTGQWLQVQHPWEMLLLAILAGLVFGFLGLASAFWAKSFDQLSAVNAFVLLPLTYLGGVFISVEQLHPFWQKVSHFNPLFYFINGMRHAIVGSSDVNMETAFAVVGSSVLVFYFVARYALKTGVFQRWS